MRSLFGGVGELVLVASLVAALYAGILPELPYGRHVRLLELGDGLVVHGLHQLGPLLEKRSGARQAESREPQGQDGLGDTGVLDTGRFWGATVGEVDVWPD